MIQQLVQRIFARIIQNGPQPPSPADVEKALRQARDQVLTADPMDLVLHMEQVWYTSGFGGTAGGVREHLWRDGQFVDFQPTAKPAWDHLAYAYVLENTRAVQIFRRVVEEYRTGEALGVPGPATQRWLDVTEALLFGGANLLAAWNSTSTARPDPEVVRRNAYWRMFGMDLAFGTVENRPFAYRKAQAANTTFVPLFEELLYELWQGIANIRNTSGANQADDDRIFRIAQQLAFILTVRRENNLLSREELAAATVLGWVELTLSADTPVVVDIGAQATNPADRLALIGRKVGMAPHSRSMALFSMAQEISILLRAIEVKLVTGPSTAWLLYATTVPVTVPPTPPEPRPLGEKSRRVITEWSAASGKDLKSRKLPVQSTVLSPVRAAVTGQQPVLPGR